MRKSVSFLLAAGVLVLAGCGGGGGSASGSDSSPVGSARVNMFITDAFTDQFSQVWVKIHKIELVGASTPTVFEDKDGKVVDLLTLSKDGASRFALLGVADVPAGTYNSVRITVAEDLSVVPTGSTIAAERKFAGADAGAHLKTLSLPLATHAIAGTDDLIVDFELGKWTDDGSLVTAVVSQHNGNGVDDPANQETADFKGRLSGLSGTAPKVSFDLTGAGATIHVALDANTAVFNGSGAASPMLVNGARVEVRGVFDTATQTLKATSLKVEDENEAEGSTEAAGAVTGIGSGGFDMGVRKAEGFVPRSSSLHVVVSDATTFLSHGVTMTREEFFAAVATGQEIEVDGALDLDSGILTATRVKVEMEMEHENEAQAKVKGVASSIDPVAKSFQVTVQKWEGTVLQPGAVLKVVVTAATAYKGSTEAAFFTALRNGAPLEARGAVNGDILTATRLELKSSGGSGGNGGGDDGGGHGGKGGDD